MSDHSPSNRVNGHVNKNSLTEPNLEKERLIKLLASERYKSIDALRDVDDFALIYPEGGWRIKDVLGHLAAWEREVLATLQAFHEADTYTLGENFSVERYNQENFEQRKAYYPPQIRMDWGMVRHELQFVVNQILPQRMNEIVAFPWGEKGTITQLIEQIVAHEAEHVAEILAVLGAKGKMCENQNNS